MLLLMIILIIRIIIIIMPKNKQVKTMWRYFIEEKHSHSEALLLYVVVRRTFITLSTQKRGKFAFWILSNMTGCGDFFFFWGLGNYEREREKWTERLFTVALACMITGTSLFHGYSTALKHYCELINRKLRCLFSEILWRKRNKTLLG